MNFFIQFLYLLPVFLQHFVVHHQVLFLFLRWVHGSLIDALLLNFDSYLSWFRIIDLSFILLIPTPLNKELVKVILRSIFILECQPNSNIATFPIIKRLSARHYFIIFWIVRLYIEADFPSCIIGDLEISVVNILIMSSSELKFDAVCWHAHILQILHFTF